MATTTTTISRSQLVEPDYLHDGGVLLHSRVTTMRDILGDNANSRYQEYTAVANGAVSELDHNLGVSLSELSVLIYTGSGNALTRVANPEGIAVPWSIGEKTGEEKTVIEVTAPASGGTHTFAVVVVHDVQKDKGTWGDTLAVAGDITLQDKVLHLVDSTAARSLTLPPVSAKLYLALKDVTGSMATNNTTLSTPGAETIDGSATYLMETDYEGLAIISDGTNYFVI